MILAMRAVGLAWDVQPVPERIYREAREGRAVLPAPEEDGLDGAGVTA